MKRSVVDPVHPERVCWGCDRYCPAEDLVCGNGTIRTPHPSELFGKEWREWAEAHERRASARENAADSASRPEVLDRK